MAATSHRIGQGRIVHLTNLAHPAQALEAALQGLDLPRLRKNDARLVADDVRGVVLPRGHQLAEECSQALAQEYLRFFTG